MYPQIAQIDPKK